MHFSPFVLLTASLSVSVKDVSNTSSPFIEKSSFYKLTNSEAALEKRRLIDWLAISNTGLNNMILIYMQEEISVIEAYWEGRSCEELCGRKDSFSKRFQ